jgi:hypothetical protein
MSGVYQNETSGRLRMEADGLIYNLQQIKQENGYNYRIGSVFIEEPQRKDVAIWPATVLVTQLARPDGEDDDMTSDFQSERYWITYTLLIYHQTDFEGLGTPEGRRAWRLGILADVESRVKNYNGLPDSSGNLTCFSVKLGGNEPFSKLGDEKYVGMAIRIHVRFAHDAADPSVTTY